MHRTGFQPRTLNVEAATYRYQVYVPPAYSTQRRWPVVLFLHGAGEGGSDGVAPTRVGIGPALRAHPERFPALVAFPQSPRGYPWRGPSESLARAVLDEVMRTFHGDPERVYVTGVSMGGYGAWRLALETPERFAAIAPICGGLDSQARRQHPRGASAHAAYLEAARTLCHLPTWVFHGDADDIIPVTESREMVAALREVGAPVRYTEYPDVEHASWEPAYEEPELMPWLLSHTRAAASAPEVSSPR